jgi:Ca2+-binding EF-hand superfamily protein
VTKDRLDRAFRGFSQHGDYITRDTYTGQGRALAEARGTDPEAPAVRDLTDQLEAMWDRFTELTDLDDEGRIDRNAWTAISERLFDSLMAVGPDDEWPLDPYIRGLFRVIDADGDGRITKEEYGAWLASLGLADDTDLDSAFAGFDENGNGSLSWEEFSTCSRQYWTQTDPSLPGSRWLGP